MATGAGSRSAFFYGTLMSPKVLHRVVHGPMRDDNPLHHLHNLQTRPALLHDHRRHRIRHADYPAVLPCAGATVRGTYVTGLTDADIYRLDLFEGAEYTRREVRVRVLEEVGDVAGKGNVEGAEFPAETYIWTASPRELEDREWDLAEFLRDKEKYWVGAEGAREYADVDEAVAAQQHDGTRGRGTHGGHITDALLEEQKKAAV